MPREKPFRLTTIAPNSIEFISSFRLLLTWEKQKQIMRNQHFIGHSSLLWMEHNTMSWSKQKRKKQIKQINITKMANKQMAEWLQVNRFKNRSIDSDQHSHWLQIRIAHESNCFIWHLYDKNRNLNKHNFNQTSHILWCVYQMEFNFVGLKWNIIAD